MTDRDPRTTARPRRGHPAVGARIVAAGLGVSTMLGLVASMGIASATADGGAAGVQPSTEPLAGASGATSTGVALPSTAPSITSPATAAEGSPQASAVPAPVTLTARPDVRVITPPATQTAAAPASPAPAATTSGSR
jgi:hypothetical protein